MVAIKTLGGPIVSRQYLSVEQAAEFLKISRSWLDKRRAKGDGPRFANIGRRIVYDIDDLRKYADGNKSQ